MDPRHKRGKEIGVGTWRNGGQGLRASNTNAPIAWYTQRRRLREQRLRSPARSTVCAQRSETIHQRTLTSFRRDRGDNPSLYRRDKGGVWCRARPRLVIPTTAPPDRVGQTPDNQARTFGLWYYSAIPVKGKTALGSRADHPGAQGLPATCGRSRELEGYLAPLAAAINHGRSPFGGDRAGTGSGQLLRNVSRSLSCLHARQPRHSGAPTRRGRRGGSARQNFGGGTNSEVQDTGSRPRPQYTVSYRGEGGRERRPPSN